MPGSVLKSSSNFVIFLTESHLYLLLTMKSWLSAITNHDSYMEITIINLKFKSKVIQKWISGRCQRQTDRLLGLQCCRHHLTCVGIFKMGFSFHQRAFFDSFFPQWPLLFSYMSVVIRNHRILFARFFLVHLFVFTVSDLLNGRRFTKSFT